MQQCDGGLTSMTGYGRARTRMYGWQLRVECRSVNHKRLSLRLEVPDELTWLEPKIGRRLREELSRGRIKVRVEVQPDSSDREPNFDRIDEDRFEAVARQLDRLAGEAGLARPVSVGAVVEYREFFEHSTGEVFSPEDADELMEVVDRAVGELLESRRSEGRGIGRDLGRMVDRLFERLDEVERLRADGEDEKWSRVEARLREAVEEFELDDIDEGRLAQEVAYYVEKGDIAEEIQRTRSHLEKLGELLDEPPGEAVGKKIDFYLQELVRETNTMSSKSCRPALTECVIEMKSLVEQMREQAANVE